MKEKRFQLLILSPPERTWGINMKNKGDKPFVSVIMPCYNHENYVAQSIESVLNQTYGHFELIVLDNGSTDRSYEVMKRYGDRIRILHVDKNAIFRSEEILVKNASGDYIANMTSDDIWKPDKLEKQMKVLAGNPEIKACFSWAEQVGEDLRPCDHSQNVFMEPNRSRYEWIRRLLLEGNCLAFPSSVIEREVYREAVKKRLPFRQLSDLYEWLLILLKHDIYVVEEPLVQFRWHGKGECRNESTPLKPTYIRTINENAILFEDIIENMEDDVFIKTFQDCFVNRKASSPKEIMCEKFFLCIAVASEDMYKQFAINYFYRQSKYTKQKWDCDMGQILEEYYGYSFWDFADYSGEGGIGIITFLQKQIEDDRQVIKEQNVRIKALQDAMNARAGQEDWETIYRRSVFEQLSDEQKELMKLIGQFIENILIKVEALSDEDLGREYPYITDAIKGMKENLRYLVEDTELKYDQEIDGAQWQRFWNEISKDAIEGEEFINVILSFLIRIYSVFQQYTGGF